MSDATETRTVRGLRMTLGVPSLLVAPVFVLRACGGSNQGQGIDDAVTRTVEIHMAAFADSDDAGICGILSSQAEGQFAEYGEQTLEAMRQAEAERADLSGVPFEISDIPSDPVEVCRLDVEISGELAGDSSWANALRRAFRAVTFGKPRVVNGGTSARINGGTLLNGDQLEISYGLVREDRSWRIDFLDLRDPQQGTEIRYLPMDLETARSVWAGYADG